MIEQPQVYPIPGPILCATSPSQVKIEYTDDAPNMRQWLMDLRRDLLRKVRQIDELLQTLDT
jgi:hypothetical protein